MVNMVNIFRENWVLHKNYFGRGYRLYGHFAILGFAFSLFLANASIAFKIAIEIIFPFLSQRHFKYCNFLGKPLRMISSDSIQQNKCYFVNSLTWV